MAKKDLDLFFNNDSQSLAQPRDKSLLNKHTRYVRWAKLMLPSLAAILLGLLLVLPSLKKDVRDFKLDITRPKQDELEKLHVENTTFYITDKDNKIHNFIAEKMDETEAGSKLIKLIKPEGLLPISETNWANIKSPTGFYNQIDNTLLMTDDVEMFYSEGMTVNSFEVTFDFKKSKGFSDKTVTAQGYFGNLKADGFEFSSQDDILVFTGHSDITIREESLKGK